MPLTRPMTALVTTASLLLCASCGVAAPAGTASPTPAAPPVAGQAARTAPAVPSSSGIDEPRPTSPSAPAQPTPTTPARPTTVPTKPAPTKPSSTAPAPAKGGTGNRTATAPGAPHVAPGTASTSAPCPTSEHRTVVFLDPGHGSNVVPTAATSGGSQGIYSGQTASGGNEDADVFAVATRAQAILRQDGYTVVLSRTGNPDPHRRTLWQEGLLAETADGGAPADIGVSLHTDVKANVGAGQIYYDNMGGWRQNNTNATIRHFTNQQTATLSKQYATVFQRVRELYQGTTITMTAGHNFSASRNLGSHGTIPIIMLTAQGVPWVYNEMGRTTAGGLSSHDLTVYVNAVVAGVEQSIPPVTCR